MVVLPPLEKEWRIESSIPLYRHATLLSTKRGEALRDDPINGSTEGKKRRLIWLYFCTLILMAITTLLITKHYSLHLQMKL